MSTSMVKGLTQIISIDLGQNLVSMSIVEKQNQSGLKYNQRLFIVVHGSFFGYISKVKMNEDPNLIKIEEVKTKIPMKNLFTLEAKEQILVIKFTIIEDNKIVPKEWVLKMGSQKLAALWKQLLQYQLKITKQFQGKAKQSKKPQSNLNKNSLEISRINQKKVEVTQEGKDKQKQKQQQLQNQRRNEQIINKNKKMKKQPKVFNNPLYNSNQIDSEEQKKKKKQKQKVTETINRKRQSNQSPPNRKLQSSQSPHKQKENNQKLLKEQGKQKEKSVEKINQKKKSLTIEINQNKPSNQMAAQVKKKEQQVQYKKLEQSHVKIPLPQVIEEVNEPTQYDQIIQKPSKRTSKEKYQQFMKQQAKPIIKSSVKQTQNKVQDQLLLAKDILQLLQQKNKKYPINQITYNHDQIQNLIKVYGKSIGEISNSDKRKDTLLNYIIQAYRGKITKNNSLKKSTNWIYKQFTENQTDNILAFRQKCLQLTVKLYISMYNKQYKQFKKIKHDKNQLILQYQDIQIKIPLINLKKSKNTNNNLLDYTSSYKILLQFQSRKQLYKIINNQGKIRISYSFICQYGGFIFLFIAKSNIFDQDIMAKDIQKDLQRLQQQSKLPFSHSLKKNIKKLRQIYYNDMRNGQTDLQFKFYFINNIDNIFPLDLHHKQPNNIHSHRIQLILQKYKQNAILPYINADDIAFNNKQKYKEIQIIKKLEQLIDIQLKQIVYQLNKFQVIFVCPGQFRMYLHENGVNQRHLKYIYENITNQYVKKLISAELVAVTIKKLFMKTLQDECLQNQHNKVESGMLEQWLIQTCIDFLNCVFGDNNQSKSIWVLIQINLQSQFQMVIDRNNLNKGQLFVSIIYHCGLNIKWNLINTKSIFQDNIFLKKIHINELQIKYETFTPLQTPLSIIKLKLQTICRENFQWLVNYFNLKETSFPPILDIMKLKNKVRLYLSNYIDSEQLDWSNNYSHLSLYQTYRPTAINYQIDIQNIFKYLRTNHKRKYLSKFTQFTLTIERIYGNNHPYLSKLYELFSSYHKTRNEAEDSISFMKSSILNYSTLTGDDNQIVAASFFKLGDIYRFFRRNRQGQECLRKAKNIMIRLDRKDNILNAKIKLSLAFYHYQAQNYQQVLKELENIGENFQQNFLQKQRIQTNELIYTSQRNLNKHSQNLILCNKLQEKVFHYQKMESIQSIMYIIFENYMQNLPQQNKRSLLKLINKIPIKQSIQYYKKAFNFLQGRFKQKSLFELMIKYGQNASKIMGMIEEKNLLLVWINLQKKYERESLFDFISMFEEFIYFFGKNKILKLQSK